mmetsp:Transcript_25871/g.74155  ORF Transcript_25871/g.74155 Transcript_25871/m.74155 type:complete len:277 (+) Transcript_25871:505-1335(+)
MGPCVHLHPVHGHALDHVGLQGYSQGLVGRSNCLWTCCSHRHHPADGQLVHLGHARPFDPFCEHRPARRLCHDRGCVQDSGQPPQSPEHGPELLLGHDPDVHVRRLWPHLDLVHLLPALPDVVARRREVCLRGVHQPTPDGAHVRHGEVHCQELPPQPPDHVLAADRFRGLLQEAGRAVCHGRHGEQRHGHHCLAGPRGVRAPGPHDHANARQVCVPAPLWRTPRPGQDAVHAHDQRAQPLASGGDREHRGRHGHGLHYHGRHLPPDVQALLERHQ